MAPLADNIFARLIRLATDRHRPSVRLLPVAIVLVLAVLNAVAAVSWARAAPGGESPTASSSLSVRIVGIPPGQAVHGVLRGPGGLVRSVSTTRLTISKARAGVYRLTLRSVTISRTHGSIEKGAIGRPVRNTTSVRLRGGHNASLVGTYGSIINPGVKTLRGGVVSVAGPPENPSSVVLSGHQTFAPRAIISMAPTVQLPRGLLSHVVAVSYRAGNTIASLRAASIYEVAPDFQFNVSLNATQAHTADFSAGCGLPSGVTPYRRIKDVSFSGGWSTADVFGVHITDGVRADVHFTVEAGIEVTAGAGLSCSLSLAFYASGLAGPIPVTAGIEGDLTGSAAVGGVLDSGGSIEVEAGGHTIGLPPTMLLIPDVSFVNPHFTLTAKQFAQATADIGVTVKAGIGAGGVASLTMNVGNSLDFTAQPGSCLWEAKFGQFSAEGELLDWHLSTPQTPALFTRQLGGNFCATSSTGGGGAGSGGSGGSGPPGGGSNPPPPAFNITNASAVSGGGLFSCALLRDGKVACWGFGANPYVLGGSGYGPNLIPTITTAHTVSSGGESSCAVVGSGAIDCWGYNSFGELGDGATEPTGTPVAVAGISNAVSVSVGETHACAALATGHVDCWGRNWSGQLGDGTKVGPETCYVNSPPEGYPCSRTPVEVDGITDATAVAVGGEHSCALLSSGTVECWGSETLSVPSSGNDTPQPVDISKVASITAGEFQTCALMRSGHVECWGMGTYGGLGTGSESSSSAPVEVSGIADAVSVSTGDDHTCVARATGVVMCWGENWSGDLGDGTDTGPMLCGPSSEKQVACSLQPVAVSELSGVASVGAGLWHSCAALTSGTVECWGLQHGDVPGTEPNEENATLPVQVP